MENRKKQTEGLSSESMMPEHLLRKAQAEIEEGIKSCHCNKCGCMIDALKNILNFLNSRKPNDFPSEFQTKLRAYLKELKSAESS